MIKKAIKDKLTIGKTLTMVSYAWKGKEETGGKVGIPRKIAHVQTNAIKFEGGSWLQFDFYKASDCTETEKGFILNDGYTRLEYIYN